MLNQELILQGIYKHKALTTKQLAYLFNTSGNNIRHIIIRAKKNNFLEMIKTFRGFYYKLTPEGSRLIGKERAYRISLPSWHHTNTELALLNYLVKTQKITLKNSSKIIDRYLSERELKNKFWSNEGNKAKDKRCVDLLVKQQENYVGYEIELTRKTRKRYKIILTKLEKTAITENMVEVIWVVKDKDIGWFAKTFQELTPKIAMSLLPLSKIEEQK